MNGIVDVYEKYFTDLISFKFDLHKRKQHSCLVCATDIDRDNYKIYSRKSTEKFVIEYLEHLKVFGFCIKLCEIFIKSVRENGILCSKVKGHWIIRKHIIHEIIVIEHFNYTVNKNLDEVNFICKNLSAEEKEKEKEKEEVEAKSKEDFNSELSLEFEMYPEKKEPEKE